MSVEMNAEMLQGLNFDDKAKLWHAARAAIERLDKYYEDLKQKNKAYRRAKELRALLDGLLTKELETAGAKNIGTRYGTIHTVTRYSASLYDPQEFMDFIFRTENWDMLDKKANVTAVRDWVETHKTLPPGVRLAASTRLSITAPKEPI